MREVERMMRDMQTEEKTIPRGTRVLDKATLYTGLVSKCNKSVMRPGKYNYRIMDPGGMEWWADGENVVVLPGAHD